MLKFLAGFLAAIVAVFLAGFCFVRLGFFDPRADIAVGALETRIAMPSLDAAVDRRAPATQNPVLPTDANLGAGVKVYEANCAKRSIPVRPSSLKMGPTCPKIKTIT